MASQHVVKISNIVEFFGDEKKNIKRGENALESNHVKSMQFDADLMIIRGEIHASMKNKTYNVQITLSKSGEITSAYCDCPRGIKCHHIATLALFGHYNIAITDQQCMWNAPKQKSLPVTTAEQMYPPKPYVAIEEPVTEEKKAKLRDKLTQFGNTVGFLWLLQCEVDDGNIKDLPIIEDIITSESFIGATNKTEFLKTNCLLDDEKIKEIAAVTIGQHANEKWFLLRKFRLTASNFGAILAACNRNKYTESLFKTLLGTYNLDGIKSIQWGRNHENNGIEYLKSNLNLDVQPTGIWLSNSGVLGASPDGLVGEDAIVEVKCPFSYRNDILAEKLKVERNKYIIYFDDNGQIGINKNHNYYHQIQGNLHILKKSKCYLCIWTLKEVTTVVVSYDPSWKENILILENFYFNQYLPKLLRGV